MATPPPPPTLQPPPGPSAPPPSRMTAQAFAAAADLRRWAEDRFVPVVVTAASRPTEHSLRKNGLTFGQAGRAPPPPFCDAQAAHGQRLWVGLHAHIQVSPGLSPAVGCVHRSARFFFHQNFALGLIFYWIGPAGLTWSQLCLSAPHPSGVPDAQLLAGDKSCVLQTPTPRGG